MGVKKRSGLKHFSAVGDGPVKSIKAFDDFLIVASGDGVYRVDNNGKVTRL